MVLSQKTQTLIPKNINEFTICGIETGFSLDISLRQLTDPWMSPMSPPSPYSSLYLSCHQGRLHCIHYHTSPTTSLHRSKSPSSSLGKSNVHCTCYSLELNTVHTVHTVCKCTGAIHFMVTTITSLLLSLHVLLQQWVTRGPGALMLCLVTC